MTEFVKQNDWPKVTVDEVAAEVTVGHVGPMADEYLDSGVPFLRSLSVERFGIREDGLKFISPEFHAKLKKSALVPGDVVIVRTGKPGTCAVIPDWLANANCSDLVIVRCGPRIRPHFLCYIVNSIAGDHIDSHTVGAVQQHFNVGSARTLSFLLPPLDEQDRILALLRGLDDKIALNRRMNATLEAMARALFRDWFVDFGPTRARMEARAPYLSPDLWALFPDRLDDEGKPEGWDVRPVGDFAELKGGKQLEKEHITETGPVPVFGGAGLMGYTSHHNADGFVISVGRVGAYCGQFFSHRGKAWINNNASLIRPNADVSGEWLLIALRHIDIDVIKKGAAQPFVSNGDIAKVGIVWPGDAIISAFSNALVSLMRKAEANERESRTLAETRDLLLPRLMSGKLRVAEAERIASEVA